MLVDSHCHLDLIDPEPAVIDGLLEAARQRGVTHFLCVCVDMENAGRVRAIAAAHDQVFASVGVHPNVAFDDTEVDQDQLVSLAADPVMVAVGETGLDYYRCRSAGEKAAQQERFRRHIRVARAVGKPVIVHCREAAADTLRILREERVDEVGGVMHCFVEDEATAQAAMALGCMISFSGIVTFRNAQALREVARIVPADRLLVETDAPYLAPVPHRGKTNQPAFVRDTAEFLAQLRGESFEALARATTANFFNLFAAATANSH